MDRVPESLLAAILPPIIRRFSKRYPRVTLHVEDARSPAVQLAELRNRKFDFVLARIVRPLNEEEDVNVEVLFNDQLVIAADAHSPWARRRKVDLADLVGEPWMLTPSDCWLYSRLKEAFEERGLRMPKATLLTLSSAATEPSARRQQLHHGIRSFGAATKCHALWSQTVAGQATAPPVARCRGDAPEPDLESIGRTIYRVCARRSERLRQMAR